MRTSIWMAAAGLMVSAATATAAPFQNGGFEAGTLNNPASFDSLAPGSTAITGWTVVGDGIDYIGAFWAAAEGSRSLDTLSCGTSGGVSQSFDTVPGATYEVGFSLAGNPDGGVKTLSASAAGTTANFTFDTAGSSLVNMGWAAHTFNFTASAASTTLTFLGGVQGGGSSCASAALDNVSVTLRSTPTPAPVPVGGGLGGAALLAGAAAWALRRRRGS